MKFKEFMDLGTKPEEGILLTKFLMNMHLAKKENAEKVKELFETHQFDIKTVPGAFLKIFTLNEREIKELSEVLKEIDELKLQPVFNNNLKLQYFKRKFIEQLKWCINNGLPYLNSDNTFASFFNNDELYAEYTRNVPMDKIKTVAQETEPKNNNQPIELSLEDRQVYNEIVENLNFLVLANPMDNKLHEVVNNALNRVVEAINRKEYKFLGVKDMVEGVMFENMELTPEENARITELVSGAFPEEERKLG